MASCDWYIVGPPDDLATAMRLMFGDTITDEALFDLRKKELRGWKGITDINGKLLDLPKNVGDKIVPGCALPAPPAAHRPPPTTDRMDH